MKKRNGVNIICKACNKEFYVPAYRKETAKFCSIKCQNHTQYTRYEFTCLSCGKLVELPLSRKNYKKKFCSIECREAGRKNEIERRRFIKSLHKLKRGSSSNRGLRKNVFLHKSKECEICGYNEFDFCLDLHHIDEDPTNNELNNIAILCCMCHKKLHKGLITL